jgi:hypothetical protein
MVIVPGKLKGSGFMETSVNTADAPPQFFHIKLFTLWGHIFLLGIDMDFD